MENSDLLFLPLGGTGEIGMNVSLYQYRGKWLMIDCGAGFAGPDIPGVDIVVADVGFIEERKDDLVGILITHIHEDHCGALVYLWERLGVNIYCTQFVADFITRKFSNKKVDLPVNVIGINSSFELGPFALELFNMTHSVPEMSAVILRTDDGLVFHSGDWKIDHDPVVGDKINFCRLEEISKKENVLAMVCDSTNVFSRGRSESESILHDPLRKVIGDCEGNVVVTLFSSNIARIETVGKISREFGKTVAVFGRSLLNVIAAAKDSGYLADLEFIQGEDVKYHKNNNGLVILCTGCQGDELAAINRLSLDNYPYFSLRKGDAAIFSSKMIPGNEKRISNVINRFIAIGVDVITEKTHKVHVSGHPYRDELRELYDVLRPAAIIPVHGENMHLHEHANFAKECGIEASVVPSDGDVVKISKDGVVKVDTVKTGFFCVDNDVLQHPESDIIKMRTRLQSAGLIMVVLVVTKALKLIKKPTVLSYGYSSPNDIQSSASLALHSGLKNIKGKTIRDVAKLSRKIIRQSLPRGSKIPSIEIQVERV